MSKLSAMDWVALLVLAVGGLNWGLVGILKFDLVAAIFGNGTSISRVIYVLVGLSAVYVLVISSKLGKNQ